MKTNYISIDKDLAVEYNLDMAFILAVMKELGCPNEWVCIPAEQMEDLTGLSRYKQEKAITNLVSLGFIEKDIKGLPAKRYLKLK